MIAVAAPNAAVSDVRAFMDEKYGDAPVAVYTGTTGEIFMRVGGGIFPNAVFLDADGEPTGAFADWPGTVR